MAKRDEFLNTEEAVQVLLDELEKMKTALETMNDLKNNTQNSLNISKNIIKGTSKFMGELNILKAKIDDLINTGEGILQGMEKTDFNERFRKINDWMQDLKQIKRSVKEIETKYNHKIKVIYILMTVMIIIQLIILFTK